jgi:tetratricopeptide (TPR) repeat protein
MKRILPLLLGLSACISSLHSLRAVPNPAANMWDDPEFIHSFTGSYAFLSEYEPPISRKEQMMLQSLTDTIQSNPGAAIQQLESAIEPASSAALDFILANLYFQQAKMPNAEKYYNNATHKFPRFRRAHQNLGLVQVQVGNFPAAVKSISTALELGAVDGRSYGLLGYSYLRQSLHYPAEAAYRQAILMQPDTLDWKLGLAHCLMQTERHQEAIALFETLIQLYPDRADFWLLQSNAYIGQNQPLIAARNIEIVRRMGKAELASLTLLGDIYINNNAPSLALSAYQSALEITHEDDTQVILGAAEILIHTAHFEEGKSMIASTRQRFTDKLSDADDLRLLTLEAKIARVEGDEVHAVAALSKIIERDALNGEALIELGKVYATQGELSKAINRFEQAEKIDGFERSALIAHAQTLVNHSDYSAALPLLRRALQIKPDNTIEDYLKRIERAMRN